MVDVDEPSRRVDREQAERIIGRAIRDSVGSDDDALSIDDLRRIAEELDIPVESIDAAVVDELAGGPIDDLETGGWVPGAIEAGRAFEAAPDAIRVRTHEWMSKHEGMRLRRKDGVVETWEKDPSLMAAFRNVLKLRGGTGQLRDLGDVRVVVAGSGNNSRVAMGTSTNAPRAASAILGAIGVLVSLVGSAFISPWALLFLGLPLATLAVVGAVSAGRAIASSQTRNLEKALDGIEQGAPASADSVVDVITDLRDAVDSGRPRPRRRSSGRNVDIHWD